MGRDVPLKTKRTNKTALKALHLFVCEEENKDRSQRGAINVDIDCEEDGRKIIPMREPIFV